MAPIRRAPHLKEMPLSIQLEAFYIFFAFFLEKKTIKVLMIYEDDKNAFAHLAKRKKIDSVGKIFHKKTICVWVIKCFRAFD